jgi:negative regulator of flagellin synthesis FlgM
MKINGYNHIQPYQKQVNKVQLDNQTKTDVKKQDQVEISTEAKNMQSSPRIELERSDKVNELKQQVASGSYQVKPEDVAKKMLAYWNKK